MSISVYARVIGRDKNSSPVHVWPLGVLIALTALHTNGTTAPLGPVAALDLAATILMEPAPPLISNIYEHYGVFRGTTAGGTFSARSNTLSSVVIYVNQNGAPFDPFRAVVLGTDEDGVPQLPVLWQSADQIEPAGNSVTPFSFNPNIPLEVGRKYFFGVDTGRFTNIPQGFVSLGISELDTIPEGHFWDSSFAIPEPSALLITVIGGLLFAAAAHFVAANNTPTSKITNVIGSATAAFAEMSCPARPDIDRPK